MFNIFLESPLRRAECDELTGAESSDYLLQFCAHCWVENEVVAKWAQKAWPKDRGCWVKPEYKKSFQVVLSCNNDDLGPLKFALFEETTQKLTKFLKRFQTDAPMELFLADTNEKILRELCNQFILNGIMDGTVKTQDLVKIDVRCNQAEPNINLGFSICNDTKVLKKNGKINDTTISNFKKEAKNFYTNLANHIATKIPIQSQFSRCARTLNPINMPQNPESCKKLLMWL